MASALRLHANIIVCVVELHLGTGLDPAHHPGFVTWHWWHHNPCWSPEVRRLVTEHNRWVLLNDGGTLVNRGRHLIHHNVLPLDAGLACDALNTAHSAGHKQNEQNQRGREQMIPGQYAHQSPPGSTLAWRADLIINCPSSLIGWEGKKERNDGEYHSHHWSNVKAAIIFPGWCGGESTVGPGGEVSQISATSSPQSACWLPHCPWRLSPETAIRPPLGCCFFSSVRPEAPLFLVESTRPAARRCPLILLPCSRLCAVMSSGDRAARCVREGWMPFVW